MEDNGYHRKTKTEVERKTEEDVVLRRWKMEVNGHHRKTKTKVERKNEEDVVMRRWKIMDTIGRPKLRWRERLKKM